jgi:hypothetical protein
MNVLGKRGLHFTTELMRSGQRDGGQFSGYRLMLPHATLTPLNTLKLTVISRRMFCMEESYPTDSDAGTVYLQLVGD